MNRLEVGFGQLLMTGATLLQHGMAKVILIGSHDGVRGVTVLTGRQWFLSFRDQGGVNASPEFIVYTVVTLGTGGRQVLGMY